jgi:hypothetical protein
MHGEWPIWSWKGENPVLALRVFIRWKCTHGRARTHPL